MKDLLLIKDLVIHFETDDGIVEAVNNITLGIKEGQTLGLVGETGAGKTTLAKGIMRLIHKPTGKIKGGEILYKDKDLLKLTEKEMREIRGKHISMIFQDPMTSLNPVMTVGEQIGEVIKAHNRISKKGIEKRTCEMLETVGIPSGRAIEYPHQFSGGMKQRVIIAIALACEPNLLIADEPTTALDVTIQAQVLEMMKSLKTEFNTSMLLITHDLGVVAQNCDFVAIIYAGEIVEYGELRDIFKNPKHPYTIGLFGSIPNLNDNVKRLKPIDGLMPDPMSLPKGCKFNDRCKFAMDICKEKNPEMVLLNNGHKVKCFLMQNNI